MDAKDAERVLFLLDLAMPVGETVVMMPAKAIAEIRREVNFFHQEPGLKSCSKCGGATRYLTSGNSCGNVCKMCSRYEKDCECVEDSRGI